MKKRHGDVIYSWIVGNQTSLSNFIAHGFAALQKRKKKVKELKKKQPKMAEL